MRCTLAVTAAAFFSMTGASFAQPMSAEQATGLVDSYYRTYLGRSGVDDPSSQIWIDQLQQGSKAPEWIAANILGSPEYFLRNGSSMEGFIQALFRDVVGRQPTPREHDFWMRRSYANSDRSEVARDLIAQHPAQAPTSTVVIQPDPAPLPPLPVPPPPPPPKFPPPFAKGPPFRKGPPFGPPGRPDFDYRRPPFPFRP